MNSSKNILRARCDATGLLIRLLFWLYAVYLAVMLGAGIWMLGRPESDFTLNLVNTGNGYAGYGFFYGSLEVDFARDILSENALNSPKLIYLLGYFCGYAVKLFYLVILRFVADIFKGIDNNDSPFLSKSCKRIFQIGALIIIAGGVNSGLLSVILGVLHYYGGTSGGFWSYAVVGIVVICFSYIFEYGAALQLESDETL